MSKGHDFYDKHTVFKIYTEGRDRSDNPNSTLERPVIFELIGDVKGQDVLDLGCGDGIFGVELLNQGVASYTGVEASKNMLNLAHKNLVNTEAQLLDQPLESWQPEVAAFDLVTSRLVLHYIKDLEAVFHKIARALRLKGKVVISLEHPVLTSNYESLLKGKRTNWLVDNYFLEGAREHTWKGETVVKYHRTTETYLRLLEKSGFRLEALREATPQPEHFENQAEFERRQRIPMFLCLLAIKV